MGTEKFIAFKEDGTAYRLKGRILRFLDNEPVSEADKTNIRSTLSVPASAEGLTPANNLSDLDNAATARTNLSVNSVDEDAEAIGTKLLGPTLYLNGSSSYVEVADDAKLSFTDGTDDLPFSVSGWIEPDNSSSFTVLAKFGTTAAAREWFFGITSAGKFALQILDTSGNYEMLASDADITSYVGKTIHICATFGGAGPNSASAFTAAADEMTLYINGNAIAATEASSGTYTGMSDTSQPVWSGRNSNTYSKGHIRNVQLFSRSLTASEVAQLARGNDLGYSDQYGGALGGVYTSDFSAGVDSFSGVGGTAAGNIDSIGGQNDNLRLTVDAANSTHLVQRTSVLTAGKRYRIDFDFYIPSTNSHVDGLRLQDGSSGWVTYSSPTLDTWNRGTYEKVATGTSIRFDASDGGVFTFQDAGGDDVFYIRNVKVTEIGTLASFSAENYDADLNKLVDISDNAFVGTGTSVSLTGRAYPVYETGTWTPSVTFGGGNTGLTVASSEGVYTRIGNVAYISGFITLSAKGSSTGSAVVTGLPFTSKNTLSSYQSVALSRVLNMAGLASAVDGNINGNATTISLNDTGATGASSLDDTNFTDTTTIRFSATYQIQ